MLNHAGQAASAGEQRRWRQQSIRFEKWGAIDQTESRRLARNPEVRPLALRVMFAAFGWCNKAGHAEFAREELRGILSSPDPSANGDVRRPSRQQINAAVKAAVQMGVLEPGSGTRCLVPAYHVFHKAGGQGTSHCSWHGNPRARSA